MKEEIKNGVPVKTSHIRIEGNEISIPVNISGAAGENRGFGSNTLTIDTGNVVMQPKPTVTVSKDMQELIIDILVSLIPEALTRAANKLRNNSEPVKTGGSMTIISARGESE